MLQASSCFVERTNDGRERFEVGTQKSAERLPQILTLNSEFLDA